MTWAEKSAIVFSYVGDAEIFHERNVLWRCLTGMIL